MKIEEAFDELLKLYNYLVLPNVKYISTQKVETVQVAPYANDQLAPAKPNGLRELRKHGMT